MEIPLLEGQVAIVTGAGRGIGRCIALTLAQHGARVALAARTASELRAVQAEITAFGGQALCIPTDVSREADVQTLVQRTVAHFGRLDIVVNNAGILEDAVIGMIGADALKRLFEVNTFGVIHNLQAAARLMRRSGGGSIVNVGSIVGIQGNRGQVAYGATKAAILGITKSAAKELAPDGIRVNAVAPGFIGQPEDVAAVVLFLVSDLSSYMTGQVLGVDGGMVM